MLCLSIPFLDNTKEKFKSFFYSTKIHGENSYEHAGKKETRDNRKNEKFRDR